MSTVTQTDQQRRTARGEHDRERFEALEYKRRRRDEITDQAERLAAPMTNPFRYHLVDGELVTDLGEPFRPVLVHALEVARQQAALNPDWQFEVRRSEIELALLDETIAYAREIDSGVRITSLSLDGSDYEALRAIAAALGHELPVEYPGSEYLLERPLWIPEGKVELSPIPDAVRVDGINIGGYNRKRLKMLVRITMPIDTPEAAHSALIDRIRDTYDDVLTARTGRKHFAGRDRISTRDALTFIEQQTDLIDAHMAIVSRVHALTSDPGERNRLLEGPRYNFSAALDDRMLGREVTSLQDSGDAARAEGRTFEGDCPTSPTAQTATSQAERLGYLRPERWSEGVCRNCERLTQIWKHEDGGCNVCQACAAAHTRGGQEGLDAERRKAARERKIAQAAAVRTRRIGERALAPAAKTVRQTPAMVNGVVAIARERLAIGGTVTEYVDAITGRVLDK